ncbi:hypothetical protein ABGB17_10960 [Sphaerisporangium sp. B11E5]|uniref:hypothetical protein n=1 Tax=Sphaerisporangium sp. B11E5 TaxID=3153563 RepID=UPI00325C3CF8
MLPIVQWVDDLLGLVQELLAAFGADVSLLTLRRILWLLVGVLLLYWTAKLIKSLLSFGESAYGFARRQIRRSSGARRTRWRPSSASFSW